jgi:hypothetical protein
MFSFIIQENLYTVRMTLNVKTGSASSLGQNVSVSASAYVYVLWCTRKLQNEKCYLYNQIGQLLVQPTLSYSHYFFTFSHNVSMRERVVQEVVHFNYTNNISHSEVSGYTIAHAHMPKLRHLRFVQGRRHSLS